ncbi:MAG: helix-turn-helix domain-containing protein [bacterium]
MGKQEDRPTKRLYTVKEASEFLGISRWTMRELQWDGKVPFVKFNRLIYFDLRDLEAFIARNKFRENP